MIASLIHLLVILIVVGLILWLLMYAVDNIPMFAPFQQVARVVITVIGVLILILLLLQFVGMADVGFPGIKHW
jgi:hypothetical protein